MKKFTYTSSDQNYIMSKKDFILFYHYNHIQNRYEVYVDKSDQWLSIKLYNCAINSD